MKLNTEKVPTGVNTSCDMVWLGVGVTWNTPSFEVVPPKVATEMILTGRRLSAAEALGYGLVNRVTEAGQALDGARALAAEILAGSPTSVRISLQIMEETRGIPDVARAVSHHSSALDDLMSTQDAAEGPAAFAAKRQPQWRNW